MNDVVHDNSEINIIEHNDAQLDLYFKIYEKANSKNEEISKSYKNNILVKFSDIKELHYKTVQSITSLNPVKSNIGIRIAVSHNEGETDKFNSFEDFEKHHITSPNPTSNLRMLYTFAVYDNESGMFENFKVINQLRSRVAELEQAEKEAPPFIPQAFIASLVTITAKITIEYDDYVKARHFTAMFDEWIRGCDESNNVKGINFLKRNSHLITKFGKLTIYAMLAIFTSKAIDANIITTALTVKFIVIYASVFVIFGNVVELFLRKIESSIDGYLALSYLNINKGDAKLIKEYANRNRFSVFKILIGSIGTICIGLLTCAVYDIIKWFILLPS
ncbi:MAG: hypothetical protein methR_P3008 [Methyloprofundus sp.]|nr:MAG: hypothetical protein methR_P3008 [Methyloprofundus sp.]